MASRTQRSSSAGIGVASSRSDVDHLDPPAEDLRAAVDHLRAAGEDPAGWQVTLVTNPRVLGYVFNPASFYLCRDPEGACGSSSSRCTTRTASGTCTRSVRGRVVIHSSPRWTRSSTSPFLETRGGYTVRVRDEPTRLRIAINHEAAEGLLLHASLDLAGGH